MKLCSQCEKENPSSANHCMYCGTALVEEERMFSLPFSFKGRIRRLEYGISCIIYFVWYVIAMAVLESDAALWAYLSFIPAYWFMLAQGAKRCHDRNNSGWYQIIPFYGLWMLFAEGDDEENDYGFPPK